ncbi:unnamed protein product [Schistocephalus solidus]|uniref:Uncharacterized protein n=1 Tax=Schistocephalus solidus TaxID=70667 RepID=A0A183TQ79_SCHSO|nr:unnamed protein product [Schistocephalus solidus]
MTPAGSAFVVSSLQPTFADPRRPHRSIATQTSEEHHCYPAAAAAAAAASSSSSSTILRRPFAMTRFRRPLRTFARPQSAPLNGDEDREECGGLRPVAFGESRSYGLRHREADDPFFAPRGSRARLTAALGEQVRGADPSTVTHHSFALPSVYIADDVFGRFSYLFADLVDISYRNWD